MTAECNRQQNSQYMERRWLTCSQAGRLQQLSRCNERHNNGHLQVAGENELMGRLTRAGRVGERVGMRLHAA